MGRKKNFCADLGRAAVRCEKTLIENISRILCTFLELQSSEIDITKQNDSPLLQYFIFFFLSLFSLSIASTADVYEGTGCGLSLCLHILSESLKEVIKMNKRRYTAEEGCNKVHQRRVD